MYNIYKAYNIRYKNFKKYYKQNFLEILRIIEAFRVYIYMYISHIHNNIHIYS